MIKPCSYTKIGQIIDIIEKNGFLIGNIKMAKFTRAQAGEFYGEHKGKHFYENLIKFITCDVVVGMELVADDAILKWRQLIGPTNSLVTPPTPPPTALTPLTPPRTRFLMHIESQGSRTGQHPRPLRHRRDQERGSRLGCF